MTVTSINKRARYVLLLNTILSVVASLAVILLVRWQHSAVPEFEFLVLKVFLMALMSSVAADLICGAYKIVIRYTDIKSVTKLIYTFILKEVFLGLGLVFIFSNWKVPGLIWIFLLLDFVLSFFLMIVARVIIVYIYDSMDDDMEVNVSRLSVVVYGTSDKSAALATRLEQSKTYIVAGYLSPNVGDNGMILMNHKIYSFSDVEQLSKLKIALGFEGILFPRDSDHFAEQERLIPMALQCGIHILSVPKIQEVKFDGLTSDTIRQVMDNDFIPDGMSAFERQFKRFVDLILSALLIVVFAIPMLVCAIAVKLRGGEGPVIYKQERIGRFGRPFYIYKFRTMRQDAEAGGAALYQGDDDPRLTKVGKFLRVHHLDEMPQLFNVLKGDMAFVGYRPERKFYIDQIMAEDPRYYYLYQIRPGVTSYATLRNGYADSLEKMLRRLEFDLYYLRHRSAWFDVKILFQTFVNIIFGKKF